MLVGAFILFLVAGVFYFILWFSNNHVSEDDQVYDIYFEKVITSIQSGTAVHYRGIRVGQVIGIELAPPNFDRVRVRIKVKKHVMLRVGVIASIESTGFTGQAHIQLMGGSLAEPILTAEAGMEYPVIQPSPSDIESFLQNTPDLVKEGTLLMKKLNDLFRRENRKLTNDILENIAFITNDLKLMTGDFKDTLQSIKAASNETKDFVKNLNIRLAKIDELLNNINAFSESAKKLVQQDSKQFLKTTSDAIEHSTEQFDRLMNSLQTVIDEIERNPSQFLLYGKANGEIMTP